MSILRLLPGFIVNELVRLWIYRKCGVYIGRGVIATKHTNVGKNTKFYKGVNISNSTIGEGTYIASQSRIVNSCVGKYCSIGANVHTSFGLHPSKGFVSTHPAFFSLGKQAGFSFCSEQLFEEHLYVKAGFNVEIGNDVWIGNNVCIMDGVTIGDGAIIGLGSIVTKNIEPYSINVGVPAKKIGYRFEKSQIQKLLEFKWWDKDMSWIMENAHAFSDVNEFVVSYCKDV